MPNRHLTIQPPYPHTFPTHVSIPHGCIVEMPIGAPRWCPSFSGGKEFVCTRPRSLWGSAMAVG